MATFVSVLKRGETKKKGDLISFYNLSTSHDHKTQLTWSPCPKRPMKYDSMTTPGCGKETCRMNLCDSANTFMYVCHLYKTFRLAFRVSC